MKSVVYIAALVIVGLIGQQAIQLARAAEIMSNGSAIESASAQLPN